MKNKKATSALLVVVVIVWGLIFYKIFSALGSSNKEIYFKMTDTIKQDTINTAADTFNIANNYRDPFLGQIIEEHSKRPAEVKKTVVEPIKQVTNVKWPVIVYSGIIKKQASNPMAIVKIDGHSEFMSEGSIISGVELKRLYSDSIRVLFNEEIKVIKK